MAVLATIWLMTENQPRLDLPETSRTNRPLPAALRERLKGSSFGHGQEKRFILNADDLNTICRSTLARRGFEGQCRFDLAGNTLVGEVSLRLQGRLSGRYLNVDILFKGAESSELNIPYLSIGRLRFNSPVELDLLHHLASLTPLGRYETLRRHMIKNVEIREKRLMVVLNWNREVLSELRGLVTDRSDAERIRAYLGQLALILEKDPENRYVKLGKLTAPLFELARSRSRANQSPIEENRALILVLSAYANGKDLNELAETQIELPRRNVLLNRRIDTARHFLAAALLSMSGQSTLVEMIGLAKELQDTHDGSGFSFIDLAADEAGAAFGKASISGKDRARRMQEVLKGNEDESQLIPTLKDLPESMHAQEFEDKFHKVGSLEYEAVRNEIKKRIRGLAIYR